MHYALARGRLFRLVLRMGALSLIPYVCGAGASLPGCAHGPLYCLEHGLTARLRAAGIEAAWAVNPEAHWNGPYGRVAHASLPPRGSVERRDIVAWHCQTLAQNVAMELNQGNRVITIGGDHSMAAGSVSGASAAYGPDATLGLIWIDAHPDIHTIRSSCTKALHGLPMAALLGLEDTAKTLGIKGGVLRPENIVYAGLRSIDSGEYDIAKDLGIRLPVMNDLRQQGISAWLQDAVTHLSVRCDHMILSLDLDGFSPAVAPAVGTPVEGGFLPGEILPVLAGIVRAHAIDMIEISEFNPTLPGADKTFDLILQILEALIPGKPVQK